MDWLEIIATISVFVIGFCYWSSSTLDFWKSRNVAGPSPLPLVGNLLPMFLGKISFSELLLGFCDKYRNDAFIGIFMRRQPVLLLVDLDLVKDVLIKDFSIFSDRGLRSFDKTEPLSQHLVNLEPARWRPLRIKLSPTFTSGKLKQMFYLLLECGQHLEKCLENIVARNEPVECRELTAKFTTDVIGTCAFGLEMDALTNEDSEFRKMGREIFRMDWKKVFKFRLRDGAPWLYSLLGPVLTDWKMTDFFLTIMKDTMNYRKQNRIVKHDFIDLIMELKEHPDKVGNIELTDTLLTAQLFVFFLAGFETSSTTISNALYELAQNQLYQDKLRGEICNEMMKNNGNLTYDAIKSMKYLDMVFKETLRKYPPAVSLMRRSNANYTFAGTNLTIPKGTRIIVPIFAIHRDSKIYPKPEIFDPERFTEEAIATRHPLSWLPFGDGPRNCIGARFANYQSKVGLIKILHHYKVDVCDKTQIPYVIDPRSFLLAPINGIYVKISKIDSP